MTIQGRTWRRRGSKRPASRAARKQSAPRARSAPIERVELDADRLATPDELAALVEHFNRKRGGDAH